MLSLEWTFFVIFVHTKGLINLYLIFKFFTTFNLIISIELWTQLLYPTEKFNRRRMAFNNGWLKQKANSQFLMFWYLNLWRIHPIWYYYQISYKYKGANGCGTPSIGISYMITFMIFFAMMILSLFIAVIL